MYKILITALLFLSAKNLLTAQSNYYNREWKKIDSILNDADLPKTALQHITKLYDHAKKENSIDNVIKAIIYKINIQKRIVEGESITSQIQIIDKEIAESNHRLQKGLLHTLKANLLFAYLTQNSWKLNQRTTTEQTASYDLSTWNNTDFTKAISAQFDSTLLYTKELQSAPIQKYSQIVTTGNSPGLRQSLYDLVLQMKLDFFKDNDRLDNLSSTNNFVVNKSDYFGSIADFIKLPLNSEDTLSSKLITLQTFQALLKYYLATGTTNAVIQTDIARLSWVHANGVLADVDTLFVAALHRVLSANPGRSAALEAAVKLVEYYNNKAETFQPYNDTIHRWKYQTSLDIIDRYTAKDSISPAAKELISYKNDILSKTLASQIENINSAYKPLRVMIGFKNIPLIFMRIIQTDFKEKRELNDEQYWKNLINDKNIVQSAAINLPLPNDFQNHQTEIKIESLKPGRYIFLASTSEKFDVTKDHLVAQLFDVSDLAYISNENNLFILNRESGQPIEGATMHIRVSNKNNKDIYRTFKSDEKGYVKIQPQNNNTYAQILGYITKEQDRINLQTNYYTRSYKIIDEPKISEQAYKKRNAQMHFFTDRSIYRPGQTVYFKGILTTTDKASQKRALYSTPPEQSIILRDANYKVIDSVKLKSNEYSSLNGSFKLPENVLTGHFVIENNTFQGQVAFNVEEYKRPTFYIEYDSLKTTYKLNDSLTISGSAKSYAGTNIDNALVKINVQRQTQFPYPWLWRGYLPNTHSTQIYSDVLKTDANGKFSFSFKASPDENVGKAGRPFFTYIIEAQISDNNGETRIGQKTLSVGYESLLLAIHTPEFSYKDSLKNIEVEATNLSGQKIHIPVKIELYKLQDQERTIRERYWTRPDAFVMSKDDYIKAFPHDEYDNELDKNTWKKESLVFTKTSEAKNNDAFYLNSKSLTGGWYLVEASAQDITGNEVRNKKFVYILDPSKKKLNTKEYLLSGKIKRAQSAGENDVSFIGSAADSIYVISANQKAVNKLPEDPIIDKFILNNEVKIYSKITTLSDVSGATKAYAFVKNNRYFSTSDYIGVKDPNRELSIQYGAFRDKTKPGSQEEWQIKILNKASQSAPAELLTTLYDASLDAIRSHRWNNPFRQYTQAPNIYFSNGYNQFGKSNGQQKEVITNHNLYTFPTYDQLNLPFLINNYSSRMYMRQGSARSMLVSKNTAGDEGVIAMAESAYVATPAPSLETTDSIATISAQDQASPMPLRTNFNETAFFFPNVYADKSGNYTLHFTMPEALTKWRWMNFAYTKNLQSAYSEKNIITQKTLMVQPNLPRFFRAGDTISITAKISNLSDKALQGTTTISLQDAVTGEDILWQQLSDASFSVQAGQSSTIKFPLIIPSDAAHPVTIKISGISDNYSDGEQHTIPVLSNKILITEAMPMYIQGDTSRHFVFEKLVNNSSNTLQTQALTLEFTSNPAWYAVQALPYLTEYPYECSEQTFNRFYGNALAAHLSQQIGIKIVLEEWLKDSASFESNLQKSPELKQILLHETPWVLDAESEAQQKRNIALLFDPTTISNRLEVTLAKLKQMQLSSGGFAWFKGDRENRYITQYIVTGIGRLLKLGAIPAVQQTTLNTIAKKANAYLSKELTKDYTELKRFANTADLPKEHLSSLQINYLFSKSYFNATPETEAEQYYYHQAKTYWHKLSSYNKGMITAILYRNGETQFAQNTVLSSLLENAVEDKENGTYWKDQNSGFYWYQAPIEQQALMIEITNEIAKKENNTILKNSVNGMQNWLIRNKQTNNWKTTKATADACYALLSVNDLLKVSKSAHITLGRKLYITDQKSKVPTSYFKETILGKNVNNEMGNVTVSVTSPAQASYDHTPAYGSVYWQYLEDINKVTPATSEFSITRQLFTENNTVQGKKLVQVKNNEQLKIGDKIVIRLILKSNRDLEYVHLKDTRAPAMEPANVLSSYKWQDGLGYYEATKDASTNFFITYLPKGTYVFEYPIYITHAGDFSAGLASIQCMYAPEFTSHSESLRISIK